MRNKKRILMVFAPILALILFAPFPVKVYSQTFPDMQDLTPMFEILANGQGELSFNNITLHVEDLTADCDNGYIFDLRAVDVEATWKLQTKGNQSDITWEVKFKELNIDYRQLNRLEAGNRTSSVNLHWRNLLFKGVLRIHQNADSPPEIEVYSEQSVYDLLRKVVG